MNQQQPQQQAAPKKTAAQRLDQLENALMSLYGAVDNMARDLMTAKEALRLLGNKTDAIVKIVARGEDLTDQNIADVMVENNIDELKNRVSQLVANGVLVSEESVNELSFVVGREIDTEGKFINPRIQFALKAMPAPTQKAILGAKPGDVVVIAEGKSKFEVLETYKIQQPKPAAQVEAAADETATDQLKAATEETKEEAKTEEAPKSNA